jgi:Domain of unknown function (DUF397)
MIKLGAQPYVTSSYSATGNCVKVGSDRPTSVQVGDTKLGQQGPALALSPAAFASLVGFARTAQV